MRRMTAKFDMIAGKPLLRWFVARIGSASWSGALFSGWCQPERKLCGLSVARGREAYGITRLKTVSFFRVPSFLGAGLQLLEQV